MTLLKHGKESRAESQGRRVKRMTDNEKMLSHGITRMNTDNKDRIEIKHEAITHEIIGAAFEVYRILSYGFLEKVSVC